jgi:hypothetical protein
MTWTAVFVALTPAVVSSCLAPFYAAGILWFPSPFLGPVALVAWAWLTGLSAALAVRVTHTVHPPAVDILSVLGGLVGFLVSWSAWLSLRHSFGTDWPDDLSRLADFFMVHGTWAFRLSRLGEFIDAAQAACRAGAWALPLVGTVKGWPLLFPWAFELLLYGYVIAQTASKVARAPYSHEARAFLVREPFLARGVAMPSDPRQMAYVLGGLATGDISYLAVAPMVKSGSPGFYVRFRSHEDSPWGTARVESLEPRKRRFWPGSGLQRHLVADRVLIPCSLISTLRSRLG